MTQALARRLGTTDAVVLGLGAMVGAGIFAAPGPAALAAGAWLPLAVVVAGVIAWCNATSSARLAAAMPQSGGTYVYATRLLHPAWGHLAGWGFVVGKTASCAAMALTVGAYAWPGHEKSVALLALAVAVALGTGGVQRGVRLTRVLLALALVALAVVLLAGASTRTAGSVAAGAPTGWPGALNLLQAAGFMFFAFAGYARLATLGEEVRDPRRTIPRAVAVALGLALALYLAVALVAVRVGPGLLAAAPDPLAAVVDAAGWPAALPVVRVGAVAASLGALLALLLGVSRTAFAMARDGHLPRGLTAVRHGVPHRAELVVAAVVAVLVLTVDLRGAIGFSSFAVLVYYAVAQVCAWRLPADQGRPPRAVAVLGFVGCVVVAVTLPLASVVGGLVVLAVGALIGRRTVAVVRRAGGGGRLKAGPGRGIG